MTSGRKIGRRHLLSGVAGGITAASAGCLGRIRAYVERSTPQQISLSIKSLPADEDVVAIQIARHLAANLERAGVNTQLLPTTADQLLRDVLINQNFDIYVARHPGHYDPDYLYSFLHSRFIEESGWQNPLGYANVTLIDGLLEDQRNSLNESRQEILTQLQESIIQDTPFVIIAFPDSIRAVKTDRFQNWHGYSLSNPLGYLLPEPRDPDLVDSDLGENELHMGTTDRRITRNRNPIAVEFRFKGLITGLLYDPLSRVIDGVPTPWLAESWSWNSSEGQPSLTVRLRDDVLWHDGEPITATDIAFTYRFLKDTTVADGDPVVPAPRFRGESSMVNEVWILDDNTVEFRFDETQHEVAIYSLTVPILPRHIWIDYSEITQIAGIDMEHVTEALFWDNADSIGSGPFRLEESQTDDYLSLIRNDDHFLLQSDVSDNLSRFQNRPVYERLVFHALPSVGTILELIREGSLDGTAVSIPGTAAPDAGRDSNITLHIEQSSAFYHIGFNNRNAPLSNPRFRLAVSRLVDREFVVDEIFNQYATPSLSPILYGAEIPPDLRWEPDHEYGFIGRDGTGAVDIQLAEDLFREAGYFYRDGQLQSQ